MSAFPVVHCLGYPRIGPQRELKFALEAFWAGRSSPDALLATAADIRRRAWARQREAGLAWVTVGDFALYDFVLDHALRLGVVPRRFTQDAGWPRTGEPTLAQRFALARGTPGQPALEMTKWFDTNYHYLVPELEPDAPFDARPADLLAALDEARAQGHAAKPVLLGPVSFLKLAKRTDGGPVLALLDALLPAYRALLDALSQAQVDWLQIDEPALAWDVDAATRQALQRAYAELSRGPRPRLLLTPGFADVTPDWPWLRELPVDGLHLDLTRGPDQIQALLPQWPAHWVLSAGIVDGRNVWRTDLDAARARLQPAHAALGERLWLAPSCSLAHVPVSLQGEDGLDAEVRPWLAFADEKLAELQLLGRALAAGPAAVADELAACREALAARRRSPRVTKAIVAKRQAALTPDHARRGRPYAERAPLQRARLNLPLLPTTTIGSFPQTADIRRARAAHKRGELGELDYLHAMREAQRQAIEAQERIGLDVLVHGEAERNDMVEFFAERLAGFAVSAHGWVQSYGSRCVKPPILWGDVLRTEPMTVDTARHAQSLTDKPVKGMLTGPVTLLQWSFVRDDQPREATARQLALAVREEVQDLEAAGLAIVQIDEPAFREGLPLRAAEQPAYLRWAVEAFGIAASGVRDDTQIHTHMCYSEFGDILEAIAAMDADVITIETSRSAMALLDDFARFAYPNEIGPGVYDIHSPRVPPVAEMLALLERAVQVIPPERLWVNPDCGLKTRGWPETEAALRHMVEAAARMRARLQATGGLAQPARAA